MCGRWWPDSMPNTCQRLRRIGCGRGGRWLSNDGGAVGRCSIFVWKILATSGGDAVQVWQHSLFPRLDGEAHRQGRGVVSNSLAFWLFGCLACFALFQAFLFFLPWFEAFRKERDSLHDTQFWLMGLRRPSQLWRREAACSSSHWEGMRREGCWLLGVGAHNGSLSLLSVRWHSFQLPCRLSPSGVIEQLAGAFVCVWQSKEGGMAPVYIALGVVAWSGRLPPVPATSSCSLDGGVSLTRESAPPWRKRGEKW